MSARPALGLSECSQCGEFVPTGTLLRGRCYSCSSSTSMREPPTAPNGAQAAEPKPKVQPRPPAPAAEPEPPAKPERARADSREAAPATERAERRRVTRFGWRMAIREHLVAADGKPARTRDLRLVAFVLDSFMSGHTDPAWPSLTTLEEAAASSKLRLRRLLDELDHSGWIIIERGTGRRANRYWPAVPAWVPIESRYIVDE